jgi:hypothetical protein
MLGIPFTLRRHDDKLGMRDEVVYLATRRMGPQGEAMRKQIRAYHKAFFGQALAAQGCALVATQALGPALESKDRAARIAALQEVEKRQLEKVEAGQAASEAALEAAAAVGILALEPNYGPEAQGIVDRMTDHELHALVTTIEMGALPKDFFPSPGTPPSASSTSQAGESPGSTS